MEWTGLTEKDLEDAIEGIVRIRKGKRGPVIPLRLNSKEKDIFEEAKKQGFCVISPRTNIGNAYWKWCSINNKPVIRVRYKARYAEVDLDMILTGYCLSERALEEVRQVLTRYYVPRKVRPTGMFLADLFVSPDWPCCRRIVKERAEEVAKGLAEIAQNQENWETGGP